VNKKPKMRAAITTAAIISPILLLDDSPFAVCFYFSSSFLLLLVSSDATVLLPGALRCLFPVLSFEDNIVDLPFSKFLSGGGGITVGAGISTFYSFGYLATSFLEFREGRSAFCEDVLVLNAGTGSST
jgi:hypothetical protein